jgi:hypothetical protein
MKAERDAASDQASAATERVGRNISTTLGVLMRQKIHSLLLAIILIPVCPAVADEVQTKWACDRITADSFDRTRPIAGVVVDSVDPMGTLPACRDGRWHMAKSEQEIRRLRMPETNPANASGRSNFGSYHTDGQAGRPRNDLIAQNTAGPVPSDDEVTSAVITYWNDNNNKQVVELQRRMSNLTAEANNKRYEAKAMAASQKCGQETCVQNPNGTFRNRKYFVGEGTRMGGTLADCIKAEQNECLRNETSDWQHAKDSIAVIKQKIQALTAGPDSASARANNLVFNVVSKNNYEGNIICYLYLRAKGTDNSTQVKVTIQERTSQWIVVGYEPVRR